MRMLTVCSFVTVDGRYEDDDHDIESRSTPSPGQTSSRGRTPASGNVLMRWRVDPDGATQ